MRDSRNAARIAISVLAAVLPAIQTQAQQRSEQDLRVNLQYRQAEDAGYVVVQADGVPGLRFDIWCYEDQLGNAKSHRYDGHTLLLTHRLADATVTTRFEPVHDGVDVRVEVTGPDARSVQAVGSLNPCWQMRQSELFNNQGDYVDDFVARCFVILEDGLTLLNHTRRIPGTRQRENDRANLPKPWIQEYFPTWRRHPGQVPGQRGYSLDRPVMPLLGCVSRDGQWLAAFAWPECRSLGQVWHDCLHPRPAIAESYDPATNRILSRGRLYILPNDQNALLAAFHRDFPNWKRPPDSSPRSPDRNPNP